MFKRKVISILLSTSMIIGTLGISQSTVGANDVNGWIQNGSTWNYYVNGNLKKGWLQYGGKWYYLNDAGVMATGWNLVNGKWYYLNSSGDMTTGWVSTGGSWHYFNQNGDNAIGWILYNGKWYYLNPSGVMATGWVSTGGKWYYLYANGQIATNTTTPDFYVVGADGAWDGKSKVVPKPVYNGIEISNRLSGLGFVSGFWQTWTEGNDTQYIQYNLPCRDNMYDFEGPFDMKLSFTVNNPEMDKIKTILNWIIPTRANDLYDMLNNPTIRVETYELDGRTVTLDVGKAIISMTFSPITFNPTYVK